MPKNKNIQADRMGPPRQIFNSPTESNIRFKTEKRAKYNGKKKQNKHRAGQSDD